MLLLIECVQLGNCLLNTTDYTVQTLGVPSMNVFLGTDKFYVHSPCIFFIMNQFIIFYEIMIFMSGKNLSVPKIKGD